MDPATAAATDRTARRIVAGTWMGALIVMATNAAHAVAIFGALGGNRLVGLGVGIAVDVALCVGLIGDRRLAQHSLVSQWGRSLRLTAGAVSMVIAVGGALITSHPFLAVLLGFLPIVLCLLTEYGQDVLLKFAGLTPAPAPVPAPPIAVAPPRAAPIGPPAHPKVVTPPTPRRPAPKPTHRPTEVTPELVARVRAWQTQRTRDGLPTGRRSMVADPALALTDGLARKVLDALKEPPHLVPAAGGSK